MSLHHVTYKYISIATLIYVSGKKKPLKNYWGATFNCVATHVAKLTQLLPKSSAQTLAENGKLLGLNPNHKPMCCFKSQKKTNQVLSRNKGMRRGRVEEEERSDLVCHLPAPVIASPPNPSPARHDHMKGQLGWVPIW